MDVTVISNRAALMGAVSAAAKRALETCGLKAESYAKQLCPVKTGRLRNSITHLTISEPAVLVGSNVEYAPYVELGHRQQPGRYVPALKKRLKAAKVAGKPFIRPAIENHMSEYQDIVNKEMSKL